MNTETAVSMLSTFVDGRPGVESVNYASMRAYRREAASVTRDRRDFYTILNFGYSTIKRRNLLDGLGDVLESSAGRITVESKPDGSHAIRYYAGQYYPTEYRKAACDMLAAVMLENVRRSSVLSDDELHAFFRKAIGRRIANRYFS